LARDFANNRNQKSDIDFAEKAYKTTTEITAGGTARTGNDVDGIMVTRTVAVAYKNRPYSTRWRFT
jgi:hypothetical protein